MKKTLSTRSVCFVSLAIGLIPGLAGCEPQSNTIVIATWNVRGYPEKEQTSRQWFHVQLVQMKPDVLCVQEIANLDKVNQFLSYEEWFTKVAFADSSDGQ